jgi:serine/threonine-protein kinase
VQGGHAVVADFGIALALEHAGGDRLTRTGITLGTPQYMAPEQAAGVRAIDARTDVYALGVVLHEMLTGESPFAAASQQAVLRRVMHEPPTALASRRADVASYLDAAVQRAMAKRPDDRFPSAVAFAAALDTPIDAQRQDPAGRGQASSSRRRVVSARAAMYAAAAMLVIGIAVGWVFARGSGAWRWAGGAPNGAPNGAQQPPVVGAPNQTAVPGADSWVDAPLSVVDRSGRSLKTITAEHPWTPRFSPDGRRVVYGAYGAGRSSSDVWVTDLDAGTTQRLTDNDLDNNDPQWSPDGKLVAYSANAPDGKDLLVQRLGGRERVLAARAGTQFPSDWLRDGSALLVTDDAAGTKHDIVVQPADGSKEWPYAATSADETAARISSDGRWVAYMSDESGRSEVYLDSYPRPSRRVQVSWGSGVHPIWRGDGRELYYWKGNALVAVSVDATSGAAAPVLGKETQLFRAKYLVGLNTMYDVSRDGSRFVIVTQP